MIWFLQRNLGGEGFTSELGGTIENENAEPLTSGIIRAKTETWLGNVRVRKFGDVGMTMKRSRDFQPY